MSFEELPHTADIRIRARAPTLDALFSDVLDALMQVMYGPARFPAGDPVIERSVDLSSPDMESLLADFLSEVLFLSEVDGLVFPKAVITITGLHLSAVLHGEPFNPQKHSGGTEVKGISYTGLAVQKDANGYMVDIVFDV